MSEVLLSKNGRNRKRPVDPFTGYADQDRATFVEPYRVRYRGCAICTAPLTRSHRSGLCADCRRTQRAVADVPLLDEAQYAAALYACAYAMGLALHPLTGAYVHEHILTNAKRGALIAWRKGYRVTEDGRFWHPNGYELFPGYTSSIVEGAKHHRGFHNASLRARQPRITYRPEMLACLCFYGLVTLHDGQYVHHRDGNWRNRSKANLALHTEAERARLQQKRYRGPVQTITPHGHRKSSTGPKDKPRLTPERAQAIRTLLDAGHTRQQVTALLHARGFPIALTNVAAVDRGDRWR